MRGYGWCCQALILQLLILILKYLGMESKSQVRLTDPKILAQIFPSLGCTISVEGLKESEDKGVFGGSVLVL